MLEIFLWSLLPGAVAGFFAGLFGLGGGAVIVPILVMLLSRQGVVAEQAMLVAVATSLATMLLTSTSSIIAHHRLGATHWRRALRLSPGILFGAVLGAILAEQVGGNVIRCLFVGYLLAVAIQMAWQLAPQRQLRKDRPLLDAAVSVLIGVLSAIVGIGGGTMTVPYLVSRGMAMKNAVATSSVCGLPIALAGTASYAWLGWGRTALPDWSVGYVYLPAFAGIAMCSVLTAPFGAKLANSLPTRRLKRYFSLVLVLLAVKML